MALHPKLNQRGACLLSLVAASAAAAVSWHCIEQPCLSLKRRLDQFKPRHRTRNLGAPALPPKIEETSLMGATK
jgi:peptidoglycan/LPS O-acetylase OafA/YrhL